MLSVLIPASNEERYIGACLAALLASDDPGRPVAIVVAANACRDRTVAVARGFADKAAARGWRLAVLDIAEPGKPNALDRADDAAGPGGIRVYLDADVVVSPPLLGQLATALDRPGAAWASGRLEIAPAESWATRAYARIWARLPFMTDTVPGAGLFAVNEAGRARWGAFPQIISDDTFVRLSFAPEERLGVPAPYTWPLVEGFKALVRVRRRQDAGVAEVAARFPALPAHDDTPRPGAGRIARLALGDPVGFAVYAAVAAAVRLGRGTGDWARGR